MFVPVYIGITYKFFFSFHSLLSLPIIHTYNFWCGSSKKKKFKKKSQTQTRRNNYRIKIKTHQQRHTRTDLIYNHFFLYLTHIAYRFGTFVRFTFWRVSLSFTRNIALNINVEKPKKKTQK